ncbi:MAG: hypothetical protein JSW51_08645 [Gemmatimonadota bacterium]|nr:MAG: hypothetical protein JSW51_08645 [Gemmatimonadota bacterium]
MPEEPPDKSNDGVKRFLTDLRSGAERRSWKERRNSDRRAKSADIEEDRRSPDDRRKGDRRIMLLDRRRRISEPYAQQHAESIREMLLKPEGKIQCPRCRGALLLGPPVLRGDVLAREVLCTSCRHSVVITGLPEETVDSSTDQA